MPAGLSPLGDGESFCVFDNLVTDHKVLVRVRVEGYQNRVRTWSGLRDMEPMPVYPGDFLPIDIKMRVAFTGHVLGACMLGSKPEIFGDDLQVSSCHGIFMDHQVDPWNSDITRKLDGPVVVMCDLWGCISSVPGGTSRLLASEKVAAEKNRHHNQDDDRFSPFTHGDGLTGRRRIARTFRTDPCGESAYSAPRHPYRREAARRPR